MSVGKQKKKEKKRKPTAIANAYHHKAETFMLPKRKPYWYDIKGYCRGSIFCFYWILTNKRNLFSALSS